MDAESKFAKLLNSALAVDAIYHPGDWVRETDRTPEELARGEAMRRFIHRPRPDAEEKSRT